MFQAIRLLSPMLHTYHLLHKRMCRLIIKPLNDAKGFRVGIYQHLLRTLFPDSNFFVRKQINTPS